MKRPCPICGSLETELIYHQNFYTDFEGSLLSGYDVVCCQACGFCFADGIPEQAAFDDYYANFSKYAKEFDSGKDASIDTQRYSDVADIIMRHIPSKNCSILDIGCATGELLSILKARGCADVVGLDPSPACASVAQRLYGIEVLTGTINNMTVAGGGFGFIIMTGTLEHIRDIEYALSWIKGALSENGQVLIQVPDALRFAEFPDVYYQQFSVEHINYFSFTSLNNLMKRHGFTLEAFQHSVVDYPDKLTGNPQITAVYCRKERIARDNNTKPALLEYIKTLGKLDKSVNMLIDHLVMAHIPIVVWGCGSHTLTLLAETNLSQANIQGFVDSNPHYWGKEMSGKKIMPPKNLRIFPYFECSVLVSSRTYQDEIVSQIKAFGITNEVITLYPREK